MLIAVDEESLINSDIANRRKRIMDGQLIDKLGRRIEQQQTEINQLRDRNIELFNELNYIACGFCKTADEAIQHARRALNGESE